MKFIIEGKHPKSKSGYYAIVKSDDRNLINSERVRLGLAGYTEIKTRVLTDEEYRNAKGVTNEKGN